MSLMETLESRKHLSATPTAYLKDGFLNVIGTPGDDNIVVKMNPKSPNQVQVLSKTERTNGYGYDVTTLFQVHKSWVQRVRMYLKAGDDSGILYDSVPIKATLYGEAGDDVLSGGAGNDLLWGGPGADTLNGKAGNDQLFGEQGWDKLYGGDGDDTLIGGKDTDYLYGGNGNDLLDAVDNVRNDFLSGGAGTDRCKADKTDTLLEHQTPAAAGIEQIL